MTKWLFHRTECHARCAHWGGLPGRAATLSLRPAVENIEPTKPLGMSLWVSHAASRSSERYCRKKLSASHCPAVTIYGAMSLASFNTSQVFSILQGLTQISILVINPTVLFWRLRRKFFNHFFSSYLQDHGWLERDIDLHIQSFYSSHLIWQNDF